MSNLLKRAQLAQTRAFLARVDMSIKAEAYRIRQLPEFESFVPQVKQLIEQANDSLQAENPITMKACRIMVGLRGIVEIVESDATVDELANGAIPDAVIEGTVKAMFGSYVAIRNP